MNTTKTMSLIFNQIAFNMLDVITDAVVNKHQDLYSLVASILWNVPYESCLDRGELSYLRNIVKQKMLLKSDEEVEANTGTMCYNNVSFYDAIKKTFPYKDDDGEDDSSTFFYMIFGYVRMNYFRKNHEEKEMFNSMEEDTCQS